jgi:putative ABC transport system substrate-binding protein
VKRRDALLTLAALGLGMQAELHAQAPLPLIGLLDAGDRLDWWDAFKRQMRELGYIEGKSVRYEMRLARGKREPLPGLLQELVARKVDVLVTSGTITAIAAKQGAGGIPVVMATSDDPVRLGIVVSLARPGGNVTGVTSIAAGLYGKRFEILHEVFPKLSRLGVIMHRGNPASINGERELAAAIHKSVALEVVEVDSAAELSAAFAAVAKKHVQAVLAIHDPLVYAERKQICKLALRHRLPGIYGATEYAEAGGLMSYGPSYPDLFRRAALYTEKILKGAKPGELPIEQPTKFELAVNLKTAQALGVKLPQSILLRADRQI